MILLRLVEAAAMAKRKTKRSPKKVLKLAALEQSKSAVLTSLSSASSQRSYDHAITDFVEWYCSEPRLAFNKVVVTRYRISLEQRHHAPSTIDLRLAAVCEGLPMKPPIAGFLVRTWRLESGGSRE